MKFDEFTRMKRQLSEADVDVDVDVDIDVDSAITDSSAIIIDGERPWTERKSTIEQFYKKCMTMSSTSQNLVAVAISFER
ncbi:MAG TPA: hypothetical protein VII99_06770 [Bacteroidia bacterium]